MAEREILNLAWRAFFFGVRAAKEAHDIRPTPELETKFLDVLRQVADGELTLAEPTYTAGNSELARFEARLTRQSTDLDRELAQKIRQGLDSSES